MFIGSDRRGDMHVRVSPEDFKDQKIEVSRYLFCAIMCSKFSKQVNNTYYSNVRFKILIFCLILNRTKHNRINKSHIFLKFYSGSHLRIWQYLYTQNA